MPKWGLTAEQRRAKPWGLLEFLLGPAKTITDPVHEDIYVSRLEIRLLDSSPMQRLRRVRQLGTTSLVYPAANHSRFSHALGTLRAAQDLLDAVGDNRTGPRHTPDLLDEWSDEGLFDADSSVLDLRFAEATVLARLGALLHDLCHVPLGHTIEDDLKVLDAHDANGARFERLWALVDADTRHIIEDAKSRFEPHASLKDELRMLILSKEGRDPAKESMYPFVADIVGNTICADLIDYLHRDHKFTGLPAALGDRFMNDFYVMSSGHKHFEHRMVVRIARDNHIRADVVTELVKYLRYRYELTERVLNHHAKIGADAMIGKLLEMWGDAVWVNQAAADHPATVADVGREDIDKLKSAVFAAHPQELKPPPGAAPFTDATPIGERSKAVAAIEVKVKAALEAEFTTRSDDGLLEYLARYPSPERGEAIQALATAVLDRRLFKLIGRAEGKADQALAREKWKKFGRADVRRQLERNAARRAGLTNGWKVVIWLPSPDMRLKVADVLVDNGKGVAPLARVSPAGEQIVNQHKELWAVSVYADAAVRDENGIAVADVLLASLKADMDIDLVRWDGEPVKSLQELGANWIQKRVSNEAPVAESLVGLDAAAAGGDDTFSDLLTRMWIAGQVNGVLPGPPPDDLWPPPGLPAL